MVITQIGRKHYGVTVCTSLGDIMQNIAKIGIFCSFAKGNLWRVLQKLT